MPITLTVRGGELMLFDPSGQSQSLDQMETIIEQLALAIPPRTTWTVYYLRSAEVTETAAMLEQLFPSSSVSTSLADDGSFFGGPHIRRAWNDFRHDKTCEEMGPLLVYALNERFAREGFVAGQLNREEWYASGLAR